MEAARPNSKVAIERLQDPISSRRNASQNKADRILRACIRCRTRKVRCPGERPCCRRCGNGGVECVYTDTRRDRLKDTTGQNRQLIALLGDVSLRASDGDRERIDELLDLISEGARFDILEAQSIDTGSDDESAGGEALASGSIGSNKDVDVIDEDMFRNLDSQATGFVGQNSEVQWLRSLKHHIQPGSGMGLPNRLPTFSPGLNAWNDPQEAPQQGNARFVTDSTFYLDRDNLGIDIVVDEFELPPTEAAERLFECYITTIHASFPILPHDFEEDFKAYIDSIKQHRPLQPPIRWRAILNLMFAIGAQFSHLIGASWQTDDRDHLVYMTRALRLLELNNTLVAISAPDIALIRATGMLSLFYLVIGHINRAWVMIGLSLRSALAVGLHLRNTDESASAGKKDMLMRTWWGLHSIESLVSATTGRPCVIAAEDCTVLLPQAQRTSEVPFPADPLSKGDSESYMDLPLFEIGIRQRLIIQKALELLYSPRASKKSWEQTQKAIAGLMEQLEEWEKAAFPDGLVLELLTVNTAWTQSIELQRERVLLAFSLFSAQILVTRPCLCRLERRIQHQSIRSASFNQKMAETCIQAAQNLSLLLPDEPNPSWIYQIGPWWCIVHNIMQAITVLLLELSYSGAQITPTSPQLLQSARKLITWLRSMRHNNAVAKEAFRVVVDFVKSASQTMHSIVDLFEDERGGFIGYTFQVRESPYSVGVQAYDDWQQPGHGSNTNSFANSHLGDAGERQQFVVDDFCLDPRLLLEPSQGSEIYGSLFVTSFDQLDMIAEHEAIHAPEDSSWP
ncbi:unnamed protein product [Periconia digitata]|uniref:Zn(2)-C6 fungal-type domain-containing protein n=1 Tax=Periconia digitata TaxID=1303443 RepID=A0A9W4UUD6_9PLEO|nr:unnamed protein product [Periconia digitata]